MSGIPLRRRLLARLVQRGTWVDRAELVAGLSNCGPAIDDALAAHMKQVDAVLAFAIS